MNSIPNPWRLSIFRPPTRQVGKPAPAAWRSYYLPVRNAPTFPTLIPHRREVRKHVLSGVVSYTRLALIFAESDVLRVVYGVTSSRIP
jgi:hypothetical protein